MGLPMFALNMKKHILFAIMCVCSWTLSAQFDSQIAHYMFFKGVFNPAAAGEGNLMKVSGLHRMQWIGIPNAPQTTYFHFQSPFVIGKTEHGAGIRFENENIGLLSEKAVHAQYAFKYALGNGHLSIGADLGFVSLGFKGDSVHEITSDYHDITGDQSIPTSAVEDMAFDMSLGLYYRATKWYAGISYTHLTQPVVEWDDYTSFRVQGTMFMMGGYDFVLPKDFILKPSAMVYTDFASWQYNLSLLLEYKQRFRGGLGMRLQDAVIVMLGMDIISGLSIGYAYELPTSKIIMGSSGSHELYLSYGFNILRQKKNSKYKSIRIL